MPITLTFVLFVITYRKLAALQDNHLQLGKRFLGVVFASNFTFLISAECTVCWDVYNCYVSFFYVIGACLIIAGVKSAMLVAQFTKVADSQLKF